MIESVEALEKALEPYPGQVVFNEEDKKVYRWDPIEGWEPEAINGNITMSAYEINKQIIGQLETLNDEALKEKKSMIREYISDIKATYFMLLCHDINYYTVFHIDLKLADECLEDILVDECLPSIGDIKAIDKTEDGAIEIWCKDKNENTYVAYFFPYDNGVIICG